MPLLLIPLALVVWFVWFVLSRKSEPKDALLASPLLSSSDGASELLAASSSSKSLKGASSSRALPNGAKRALPPA